MTSGVDTIELARDTRTLLGFGNEAPLPDILQVVEEAAGVAVTLLELPLRFACAYARTGTQGFIFVNANLDLDEQRFALAHAYGHHVLGHRDILDDYRDLFDATQTPSEIKANDFATEFLLPRPAIARSLRGWRLATADEVAQPQTVFRLAKYFGVSPALASSQLAYASPARTTGARPARHEHLEIADEDPVWTPFAVRHDSLAEAQQRLPRMPAALQAATIRAYKHGDLGLDELAEALQRDPDETQAWLSEIGISGSSDSDR